MKKARIYKPNYRKLIGIALLAAYSQFLLANTAAGAELDTELDHEFEEEINDELDETEMDLGVFEDTIAPANPTLFDNLITTLRHELGYTAGDSNKLTTNRSSLRLQWHYSYNNWLFKADAKSAYDFAFNDTDYSRKTKQTYQHKNRVREFYLKSTFSNISVTLGRQIVIWGKADGAQVTDVISPRDLTESVFIPIEDARLGQTMLVVSGYRTVQNQGGNTQHEWSFIVNPDKKPNEFALPGHPYAINPFRFNENSNNNNNNNNNNRILNQINLKNQPPGFSLKEPELGFRWARTKGKLDTSFMLARVHDNNPTLSLAKNQSNTPAAPSNLATQYHRYTMIGAGLNWAKGAFVWKGELAKKNHRTLNCFKLPNCVLNSRRHHIWDAAFGFDYNANGNYTLSLEVSNQHISDWNDSIVGTIRNRTLAYGAVNKTWRNETISTQYTHLYDLQAGDALHRLLLEYDISDYWMTAFQIDYFDVHKTGTALSGLHQKHRIAISIEVNF